MLENNLPETRWCLMWCHGMLRCTFFVPKNFLSKFWTFTTLLFTSCQHHVHLSKLKVKKYPGVWYVTKYLNSLNGLSALTRPSLLDYLICSAHFALPRYRVQVCRYDNLIISSIQKQITFMPAITRIKTSIIL